MVLNTRPDQFGVHVALVNIVVGLEEVKHAKERTTHSGAQPKSKSAEAWHLTSIYAANS